MRLLQLENDGGLSLTKDLVDNIPPYAILSHTWGDDDEEVTFQDVQQHTGQHKAGYRKLTFCGAQGALDGLQYFWVDTCCIDKSSSAELTEAINSMFRWYQNATQCYVDLADVSASSESGDKKLPDASWTAAFRESRWFSRGWTLQELLAPRSVTFFSVEGQRLGDKTSLEGLLQEITGISPHALQGQPLSQFSVHERFSWMRKRATKRPEDRAYSLLGIFDIYLPLIYGEGEGNASSRLREAIENRSRGRSATTSEDAKKGHFVVPFGRNKGFVGRESVMRQLMDRIPPSTNKDDCQRTAVEGLGGVGKTQVAIEAAYRVRDAYPACSVFWVPAIDFTTFENAYRAIGQAIGIPGIEDDKADVKGLVKRSLEKENAGYWFLIIDNADDIDLLFAGAKLMSYIPFSRKGSLLFTTRNHQAAVRFRLRGQPIRLHAMDHTEASQLLRNGVEATQTDDDQSTAQLLEHLAYLPLAIKQASAYMAANMNVTVSKYLGYCQSNDRTMIKMLSRDFDDQDRYDTIRNPIATTWFISFEQILRRSPLAASYLHFMCYLAEKDIPVSLLPTGDNEMEKNEAISILKAYAFIASREVPGRFDVHRLLHVVMRNWLQQQGQQAERVTEALRRLSEKFPWPTHANRNIWALYLPHAQSVLEFRDECTEKIALGLLQHNVAEGYFLTGNYVEAEKMHRESLALRKELLGREHPDTLSSMNNLAESLRQQGNYDEAEQLSEQTLVLRMKILGPEDASTLDSMNSLATVLERKGKYGQAERIHRQTLVARETTIGREHPSTLNSMNNLAVVLDRQGKYREAETMHRQTLTLRTAVLGREHPSTLDSMNNLAVVLDRHGKYEEAERMHRETLVLKEKVLGREHPATLMSSTHIANALHGQGKHKEGEKIHRQTLALKERVLGPGHPDTLMSKMNIANALYAQGRYNEAETMHRQTLALKETALGQEHPATLGSMNNLALVLESQGKYEEAEMMHRQTLALKETVLGQEHPATLMSMHNLALVLESQGKYEEAEMMHRQTLALKETVLGQKNPSTLRSLKRLTEVRKNLETYG